MGLFDFNTGFTKEDTVDCSENTFVVNVGQATTGLDKALGSLGDIYNKVDGAFDQNSWQSRISPLLFKAQSLRAGMMGQDDTSGLTRDQMSQYADIWQNACGLTDDFNRHGSIGTAPSDPLTATGNAALAASKAVADVTIDATKFGFGILSKTVPSLDDFSALGSGISKGATSVGNGISNAWKGITDFGLWKLFAPLVIVLVLVLAIVYFFKK